ncbi:MAG: DUF5320 domain-containing protein [Candidatus Hodarchaeota archaeon]
MGYGGGRGGGGRRYRWMFNLTGLPGWMRFGFSPGWVGRSPTGLPPTAQWLMQSGLLPQFQEYLQSMQGAPPGNIQQSGQPPTMPTTPGMPFSPFTQTLTKEQEIQMLRQQADYLKQQLEQIEARLKELSEGGI